jgi:uncharacterized protein
MKQIQTIVNTVLACALIFLLLASGLPNFRASAATVSPTPAPAMASPASSSGCDVARTVQVSGSAVVNVKPDRALIQLGVQSNGRSAKEAQRVNADTITKVAKALKALGVESRDISTDWYTIQPIYEDYDSMHIKGYRIYNVIAVTMRDVGKTNDAIAAAFGAGANEVQNVDFYTSELRKYRDQARDMAMKAASEKAQALAQAAGAQAGCVLTINENTQSFFNGWMWWYGGASQNQWSNATQNVATPSNETPALDDGPVSAGTISVRAEVSATFALK